MGYCNYYNKTIILLFLLIVVVSNADLLGIVSFPKNPGSTVLVSVRFDNDHKLTTINKIFSTNQELDTKFYNFNNKRYAVGVLIDFAYKCRWSDSILTDYFSVSDIMTPAVYDISMSRSLSLFFSGSWVGENVTRVANIIQSDYWQMQVLTYDVVSINLYYLVNSCSV